jgi:hypothetical protein
MQFIIGFLVFILLFQTPFLSGMVLFYRGIVFLTLVTFVVALIFRICWRHNIASSAVIFFCITLVFFTHLPVTAERSISVFLLGYMNKNSSKTVSTDELSRAFTDTYVNEQQALSKRLNEQIATGTIVKGGDGYTITPRGKLLMRLYSWIADIFKIKKNNLSM